MTIKVLNTSTYDINDLTMTTIASNNIASSETIPVQNNEQNFANTSRTISKELINYKFKGELPELKYKTIGILSDFIDNHYKIMKSAYVGISYIDDKFYITTDEGYCYTVEEEIVDKVFITILAAAKPRKVLTSSALDIIINKNYEMNGMYNLPLVYQMFSNNKIKTLQDCYNHLTGLTWNEENSCLCVLLQAIPEINKIIINHSCMTLLNKEFEIYESLLKHRLNLDKDMVSSTLSQKKSELRSLTEELNGKYTCNISEFKDAVDWFKFVQENDIKPIFDTYLLNQLNINNDICSYLELKNEIKLLESIEAKNTYNEFGNIELSNVLVQDYIPDNRIRIKFSIPNIKVLLFFSLLNNKKLIKKLNDSDNVSDFIYSMYSNNVSVYEKYIIRSTIMAYMHGCNDFDSSYEWIGEKLLCFLDEEEYKSNYVKIREKYEFLFTYDMNDRPSKFNRYCFNEQYSFLYRYLSTYTADIYTNIFTELIKSFERYNKQRKDSDINIECLSEEVMILSSTEDSKNYALDTINRVVASEFSRLCKNVKPKISVEIIA